jgi:glycosyltransferase involved in cell wall biosynthesis
MSVSEAFRGIVGAGSRAGAGEDSGAASGLDQTRIPTVSIGLPVYNGERYLEQTIRSILQQTYTDFELIIGDNASTDGTEELCRRMAAADPRIRYYRYPQNVGGRRNHHRVLELSRGRYFRFQGHDDILKPRYLECLMEALEHNPDSVLAFSSIEVIDENGAVLEKRAAPPAVYDPKAHIRLRSFWKSSQRYQPIFLYGIVRREALARTSLFGSWYGADRWLVVELALMGRFAWVEDVLFQFREHRERSWHQRSPQAHWESQPAGYIGVLKRAGHAVRLLKKCDLPMDERLAVVWEGAWYAWRSSYYWIPLLARELVAAIRHRVARM